MREKGRWVESKSEFKKPTRRYREQSQNCDTLHAWALCLGRPWHGSKSQRNAANGEEEHVIRCGCLIPLAL